MDDLQSRNKVVAKTQFSDTIKKPFQKFTKFSNIQKPTTTETKDKPLNTKPKQRDPNSKMGSDGICCYNCGKYGHKISECPLDRNNDRINEFRSYYKALRNGDLTAKRPAAANLPESYEPPEVLDFETELYHWEQFEDKEEREPLPQLINLPALCSQNNGPQRTIKIAKDILPIRIPVYLKNHIFTAIIDSGSVFSCIDQRAFNIIKPKLIKWPYDRLMSIDQTDVTPNYLTRTSSP